MTYGPGQRTPIDTFESALHNWLTLRLTALADARKQIAAEDRCEGQRHNGGSHKRCDEGHTERREHTPLHATKEEERHEADNDDDGGVQDRYAHLAARLKHHLNPALALPLGQRGILAKTLKDILYIHNGVINKRANGNGHATETHSIDGQSH